jgi:hypothetical protein
MLVVMLSPEPETVNALPIVAEPAHVKGPVKAGLAFGAFRSKLTVVALRPNSVNMSVAPAVKLEQVIVPIVLRLPVPPKVITLFVPPYHLKPRPALVAPVLNHKWSASIPIPKSTFVEDKLGNITSLVPALLVVSVGGPKAEPNVNSGAVIVPVKVGLSFAAFRSKAVVVALRPNSVNTLVVPTSKAPLTVKAAAVAVPVKAGLARLAFKFKLAVVALRPNSVRTLVAPISRAPLTVKAAAVAVPVKAGLARLAFKFKAVLIDAA